jgi:hypothetical protein
MKIILKKENLPLMLRLMIHCKPRKEQSMAQFKIRCKFIWVYQFYRQRAPKANPLDTPLRKKVVEPMYIPINRLNLNTSLEVENKEG